jgi:hypothetical protein
LAYTCTVKENACIWCIVFSERQSCSNYIQQLNNDHVYHFLKFTFRYYNVFNLLPLLQWIAQGIFQVGIVLFKKKNKMDTTAQKFA